MRLNGELMYFIHIVSGVHKIQNSFFTDNKSIQR